VIYHQAPTKTWHFCTCGKTSTRFIARPFDSKVWVCAGWFAAKEKATPGTGLALDNSSNRQSGDRSLLSPPTSGPSRSMLTTPKLDISELDSGRVQYGQHRAKFDNRKFLKEHSTL